MRLRLERKRPRLQSFVETTRQPGRLRSSLTRSLPLAVLTPFAELTHCLGSEDRAKDSVLPACSLRGSNPGRDSATSSLAHARHKFIPAAAPKTSAMYAPPTRAAISRK